MFHKKLLNNFNSYPNFALLIARIFTGFLMLYLHGWGKLIAGTSKWERLGSGLSNSIGLDFLRIPLGFMASFSESIGAILIIVGLFTRPAAFLLAFTMLVASFKHIPDGLKGMEKPLLFLGICLCLVLVGAGKYSLDSVFNKKLR